MARLSPKATSFMNVKRRVIYTTASGKYIVKTDKGVKYAPKVKYYKNPAGSTVNVKYAHGNVAIPSPIRPKMVRKMRKNAGAARGKYAARAGGVRVSPMFNLPNPMGVGMRRVRKNKGMKRGPRGLRMLANTIAKM